MSRWNGRFDDYALFHREALWTGDVDPTYPVIRRLSRGRTRRSAAWLSFLHVAFYDLGSAVRAHAILGERPHRDLIPQVLRLPCGTERRAHRNTPNLDRHLKALIDRDHEYGGLDNMLLAAPSYNVLAGEVTSIWGNGRWATYKTCELVAATMVEFAPDRAGRWEPSDMGHAHSTGPRKGLALISAEPLPKGNTARDIAHLDSLSEHLVLDLRERGLNASAATAETTLCDFKSLVDGRYYVGHDIDQMGDQLRRALRSAQAAGLPDDHVEVVALHQALGYSVELFQKYWPHSVDPERRKAYRDRGELLLR